MNNFEQHIKDQMQNFAPAPPPAAWAGVESGLGNTTAAKVGGKLIAKWVAGILITGGVITTAVIYNSQSANTEPHVTVQNNNATENVNNKSETNSKPSSETNNAQHAQEDNNSRTTQNTVQSGNSNSSQQVGIVVPSADIEPAHDQTSSKNPILSGNENRAPKKDITPATPIIKMSLSDNTICLGQTVTAVIQNGQGASINWGDGETEIINGAVAKHAFVKEGKYMISLKGISETVVVKKPYINVEASMLNSTTVLYKITNPDNVELNVHYSDGTSEIVTKKEVRHKFKYTDGVDVAELKAEFANTSCKVNHIAIMKSVAKPLIADVFTPNGDGSNDKFFIDFKDSPLKFYHIEILDSKGQTVFESFNPNETWDGTYKNVMMPKGTYTLMLLYQFEQFAEPEKGVQKLISIM